MRRNVLFNTAGSLLFYICQAAITLLVTALAGPEANGLLATGMTIANVCLSAASYGMRTFQVSDLTGKYTDRSYLLSRYITLTISVRPPSPFWSPHWPGLRPTACWPPA